VYRSEPLDQPLEITGWPKAELRARTSATDVDWLVELNVVSTDGVSRLVSEGIARARYRDGRTRPLPVVPGAEETYRVELRPISVMLQPGDRLEVAVSGGKFPTYERNPGSFIDLDTFTSEDFVVSHNEILSGVAGSHLVLPVVPAAARGTWVRNPWPGSPKWRRTTAAVTRALMGATGS
jgi:putative CocE/NonD family hydrolase